MTSDVCSKWLPDISDVRPYTSDAANAITSIQNLHLETVPNVRPSLSNLMDFSTTCWRKPRTVGDFLETLASLHVEGPLTLTDGIEDRFKLGEGGQFTVYRNTLLDDSDNSKTTTLRPVAIKKCITFHDASADHTLDLLSSEYQTSVHDMLLEVAALRDSRLDRHRNIVELLGYGVDMNAWHETPFLVMELAIGDLTKFLSSPRSWEVLQQLCLDIGCGLDVIHQCDLVHGDLKPLNILVFQTPGPVSYVARLADFGFSVGETENYQGGLISLSGCSHGWAAPEVETHFEQRTQITVSELRAADNYAYGLVMVSVLCHKGQTLPDIPSRLVQSLDQLSSNVPDTLRGLLRRAVDLLLVDDYTLRPKQVAHLLKDDSITCTRWLQAYHDFELEHPPRITDRFHYDWELPSLAPFFVQGLERSFNSNKAELTGPQLLAMYLIKSYLDASGADKSVQVEVLLQACRKGFPPAQGIAHRVLRSYGMNLPAHLDPEESGQWLFNAASTGAIFASHELTILNPGLASQARDQFQAASGYNQFYCPIFTNDSNDVQKLAWGNHDVHRLAAYGKLEALKFLLDKEPSAIDSRNSFDETPLYKACMAGHYHIVLELCRRKADASLTATDSEISCLHWLFNFTASETFNVLRVLLGAGANLNHTLTQTRSLVNHHFPFTWPPGTPLHWAVAASSTTAIAALIDAGADPCVRNKHDPYVSDENVRQMHRHGNAEQGEFSQTPAGVLGMTPVDLAVAAHNWEALQTLAPLSKGKQPGLLSRDEEGYTPVHRLSCQRVGRTVSGLRFWYPALRGDFMTRKHNLKKTIEWLQAVGGDIEQLTGKPSKPALHGVDGLNALMIAVTKFDDETVEALCEAGADTNVQNRSGRTTLTLLEDGFSYHANPPGSLAAIVACLIKHGADPLWRAPDGLTPLQCIAGLGDIGVFRMLLDAGAEAKGRYKEIETIAYLIFSNATQRLVLERVKRQEVEERDIMLSDLLQSCIRRQQLMPDFIVDDTKATLLHCCAAASLPMCTAMLIRAGASTDKTRVKSLQKHNSIDTFSRGPFAFGTPGDLVDGEISKFLEKRSDRLNSIDSTFIYTTMKQVQDNLQDLRDP